MQALDMTGGTLCLQGVKNLPATMKPAVSPRRTPRSSTCWVELLALSCNAKGFPTVMNGGQLDRTCSHIHGTLPMVPWVGVW